MAFSHTSPSFSRESLDTQKSKVVFSILSNDVAQSTKRCQCPELDEAAHYARDEAGACGQACRRLKRTVSLIGFTRDAHDQYVSSVV